MFFPKHYVSECFVSNFVLVQGVAELIWSISSETIWLVSLKAFIIRKLSDCNFFFDVLREFVRDHIDHHTDK